MSAENKPLSVALAREVVLESERSGAEAIYWLPESSYKLFFGARGIRVVTTIFEITANTQVKVFGQYSYDGKTWEGFARTLDGLTNGYTAVGTYESTYADGPEELGPLVRIGIQVKNTGTEQSQVRISSTAVVLHGNITSTYGVFSGSQSLTAGTTTPTAIGSSFDGSIYDEGQLLITYTGTPTNLVFSAWVSADGGTTYGKAAEAAAISVAPNAGEAVYIALPYLGQDMIVKYTLGAGSPIACTAIQFIGRVN